MKYTVIVVAIISVVIIIAMYFKDDLEKTLISHQVEPLMNFSGLEDKTMDIQLNKIDFDMIIIGENQCVLYFPEDCPDYKSDILVKNKDRYFIPKKNKLILLNNCDYSWTNKPTFEVWSRKN